MKKLTFLLITKRVESLLQAIQYGQKKYRAFITLAMNTRYGRSDRIRTCGIDVPNVARYQLRHTPKCEKYSIFRSFSVSGQTCGQTAFYSNFEREHSAEKANVYKGFQRFSGFHNEGAVSWSQTRRATNCATPRSIKLWSKI